MNAAVTGGTGFSGSALVERGDSVRALVRRARAAVLPNRPRHFVYVGSSDERATQRQSVDALADALGLPRSSRHVKKRAAFIGACLIEGLCGWLKRDRHVSRAPVQLVSAEQIVNANRMRAEPGWEAEVSRTEGMRRIRRWYRQHSDHRPVRAAPVLT